MKRHISRKRQRHIDRQFARTGEAQWEQWMSECSKECKCHQGVCEGVLSGGLCDNIQPQDEYEDET